MTVQEMFDGALAIVNEHNSVVGQGNPGYLDPESFLTGIKLAGGTSVDRLKHLSYEDILACMPGTGQKPIALAKDIAKVFRGKEDSAVTNQPRPVSAKKADKMSLRELVEAYDPEESENPVGKRLKDISRGEKFIVFTSGRTVDVDTTFKLLDELKKGYEGRENIDVNGDIKEIHPVGALPDNFVEENPLYRNRPLRPDGTCDQTNRSWNGVSVRVRQLLRVAMDIGVLKDISFERVHDLMDMVMDDKAFDKLTKRYTSAALEFKKLDSVGKLPTLKLVLKTKGAGKTNRPFENAKKVEWIEPPKNQKWPRLDNPYIHDYYKGISLKDADTYSQYWRQDNE